MVGLEIAEEHVLHAIGGVEHADHRAALGLLQGVEEHALALLVDLPIVLLLTPVLLLVVLSRLVHGARASLDSW